MISKLYMLGKFPPCQYKYSFNRLFTSRYTFIVIFLQLNKDTNDLLWLAIVGLTDQYIHQVRPKWLVLRGQKLPAF